MGALIVATGRSDFDNQINNVLAFPEFLEELGQQSEKITNNMLITVAINLSKLVKNRLQIK